MRTDSIKKYVIPNIPYLFILWACLKLGTAYRLAPGADFAHKLMGLGQSIGPAFADFAPGLHPLDWLIGIVGAVGFRLLIYMKSKNAKKFRRDEEYIHDMKLVQKFAELNRQAMMDEILKAMKLHSEEQFTTIHNYIDTDAMILRKGAVSAEAGEKLLIPINMRDGSLVCIGKGNDDWNRSAPHGAGRLMSRAQAKESFTVSEFKKQMDGIYTTSVSKATLDECPMAYKGMADILENIGPTADVESIIKPVYNFKAGDED